jgi:hypothetical protein
MIEYSHAQFSDYKHIQEFIKNNWDENHILAKNKSVFDHLFMSSSSDPQFFIARNDSTEILGILGYITDSQYDDKLNLNVAWLSMWMAKKSPEEPVGIKLIQYLEKNLNVDFVASLGVGEHVLGLYERMGYEVGQMHHIKKDISSGSTPQPNFLITKGITKKINNSNTHNKSFEYMNNKYLNANFYDYELFTVSHKDEPITSIVGRILFDHFNQRAIFRIIDFYGNARGLSVFCNYANSNDFTRKVNYIDMLISDDKQIDYETFNKCTKLDYLPLFFEPLISDYKIKNFCFKKMTNNSMDQLLIVTGDCDQERPNQL